MGPGGRGLDYTTYDRPGEMRLEGRETISLHHSSAWVEGPAVGKRGQGGGIKML